MDYKSNQNQANITRSWHIFISVQLSAIAVAGVLLSDQVSEIRSEIQHVKNWDGGFQERKTWDGIEDSKHSYPDGR